MIDFVLEKIAHEVNALIANGKGGHCVMSKKTVLEDNADLTTKQLTRHRGDYGFDAPSGPISLVFVGVVSLIVGGSLTWMWRKLVAGIACLVFGVLTLLTAGSYIYTTRRGKFQTWARLLAELQLKGDEQVIDLGCGRGAVLLMAARLLPQGKVYGVDLWRSVDQSDNAPETTLHNAGLEGVAERVELRTADIRSLPFAENSFDVVLSSMAIHNIPEAAGRLQAINEAVRVLKLGGRLLIVDIKDTSSYASRLRELGMAEVTCHRLDWHFWYGGPWVAARLVKAYKPA
jgi:SAM-dependent methyltransferase